jgi:predicted acetyltransferase
MSLRLRPLKPEDEPEARAAHGELARDDGWVFLLDYEPGEPWAAYMQMHENRRRGLDLPPDRVPGTFLVAEVDGEIVGRVSIRHELNEFLTDRGGHIGYGVRPAHRRRGYAGEILRQSLVVARAAGVGDVLITCDEQNVASRKVIERQGGKFEDARVDDEGTSIRRYWIVG